MVLKASSHSNSGIIFKGWRRVFKGSIRLSERGILPSEDGFIRLG